MSEGTDPVLYGAPANGVVRITLNRPERKNAQDVAMLYALDDAFRRAAQDSDVRVIILDAAGDTFSSGHDLKGDSGKRPEDFPLVGLWADFSAPGQEGMMAREWEIYLGLCERWRALPKPTIAQVQGKCIAGGLMLAWVCDLIVAGESTQFQDPVLAFGMCGSEFFMHPFELGVRRAKDWLFTSDWLGAEEARAIGMVARVFADDALAEQTGLLAERIALKSSFALKMAKEALNQSQDACGRRTAMLQSFSIHQLCHSHWRNIHGIPVDPTGLPDGLREGIHDYFAALDRKR
ncbi:enoyl-CoA hydratase [Sphingomonas ursincola]|uniref:Enoyl-CoA hydratase n=1 Tax=Sphingomonas ursincola TaxID=56361 RepID=A0A7V8U9I3_9SPHN|nr:enoyl-CoA hydratase [Sphingomonas ursincola]MBA1375113.1 enoyl-CoA hydratase [Sphingomonas ursincola]